MREVKDFIARFNVGENVQDVFTNGCCYWFAKILYDRFQNDDAVIVYDNISNHFGTRIDNQVFDITGDVTDKYVWETWSELEDELLKNRIIRDCIMF